MLMNEAIRLASRQEQNHDSFDSSHQPVASTHDRGHADAQVLAQDPEIPSCCGLSIALTKHLQRSHIPLIIMVSI